MVLSRFWLAIFISSILFVVFSLFSGNSYTIDHVLNGKKDDPILISEKYLNQVPVFIKDSIKNAPDQTMVVNRDTLNADTTYVYKSKFIDDYFYTVSSKYVKVPAARLILDNPFFL